MSGGDDADARAVLADELLQRGDQRGELIQLQLALDRIAIEPGSDRVRAARRRVLEERIAAVLDALHDVLYGELAAYVTRRSSADQFDPALEVLVWRAGRADTVWLQTTRRGLGLADAYRTLARLELAAGIRRLDVGLGYHEALVAAMTADRLPALRSLLLGSWRRDIPILPRVDLPHLGLLRGLVDQLEELDVCYAINVAPLASPVLRKLRLTTGFGERTFVGELPALEHLALLGIEVVPESLAAFARLRRLEYINRTTPSWLARLLGTDHAITTLVYAGRFSDDDAAAVLASGARIAMTLSARYEDEDDEVLAGLRGKVPPCIEIH